MSYSFKYQPMPGSRAQCLKKECQGTDWVTRMLVFNRLVFTPPPGRGFTFEGFFQAFCGMNVGHGEFVWRKYNVEEQRFVYL